MTTATDPVPIGTRDKCSRCGRTVWLRQLGTIGLSPRYPRDTRCYQWLARRGTQPNSRECPVSDGWPTTYHDVHGLVTVHITPAGDRHEHHRNQTGA